ncbi:hypothetical protein [Pantoea agglomerans]|uniref:hypothetical protein n=1 Tax=Enterobacter agglomerans TaxID=549 RepID=UPI003C7D1CD7
MTTTITTSNADTVTEQSASYSFLEAILHKDAVTLRKYGVDDKTTNAIDLKTQIDVAQKLLASDNNQRRSMSKRLMAAQAGLTAKNNAPDGTTPNAVTGAPAEQTSQSTPAKAAFHLTVPRPLKAV